MRRTTLLYLILSLLSLVPLSSQDRDHADSIELGVVSCIAQWRPRPVLEEASRRDPELFLFLGDNIYADTTDPVVMRRGYQALAEGSAFTRIRESSRVMAVWDDHDYGRNDAGRGFPIKEEAEEIFLDFWEIPPDDPRRERPGIYGSETHRFVLDGEPLRLQFVLLDTRYFRSPLRRAADPAAGKGPYGFARDPERTILGEAQWNWLEDVLRTDDDLDLRVLASSVQVLAEHHGYESWSNMPRELSRLLGLLRDHSETPTLIVSGDRHFSELSARRIDGRRMIDVTSSSVNIPYPEESPTPNRHRLGRPYLEPNATSIRIHRADGAIRLGIRVIDRDGSTVDAQHVLWEDARGWVMP